MTFSYSVLVAEYLDFITVFGLEGKPDDTTSMGVDGVIAW